MLIKKNLGDKNFFSFFLCESEDLIYFTCFQFNTFFFSLFSYFEIFLETKKKYTNVHFNRENN